MTRGRRGDAKRQHRASCESVSRQLVAALENTKPDEVKAQVQDGTLMITIPKMEKPKPNVRKNEIS